MRQRKSNIMTAGELQEYAARLDVEVVSLRAKLGLIEDALQGAIIGVANEPTDSGHIRKYTLEFVDD